MMMARAGSDEGTGGTDEVQKTLLGRWWLGGGQGWWCRGGGGAVGLHGKVEASWWTDVGSGGVGEQSWVEQATGENSCEARCYAWKL